MSALKSIDGACNERVIYAAGITNHDEYSLVRENQEDEAENKPNFGTLTLRRKKDEKERDVKMEQLKKKIKTDDERESIVVCTRRVLFH